MTALKPALLRPTSSGLRSASAMMARPRVLYALHQRLSSTSLINRVFGTHPTLLDTPFSLLPRLIEEDFTRSLDMLNRAVGGLVHVETDDKTKVWERAKLAAAAPRACAH